MSMDFTTLNLGPAVAARAETAATIEAKGADGKPVLLANGEALRFTVLLPGTPEGQREMRKWGMTAGAAQPLEKPTEATEAELDAETDRMIGSETELIARLVREWNLIGNDGEPVECSLENRRGFFAHFGVLRADLMAQMNRQSVALGNGKPA